MRNILPAAFCLILVFDLCAQVNQGTLTARDFTVQVSPDGAIENWAVGNSARSLIYTQNLWIGGLDNANALHQSSQTYRQSKINFFPGPVSTSPNATNRYNRVWKINKTQVDSLRQGLYNPVPAIFYEWPAHGDTTFGEPQYLAPFKDVDQDGVYDPDKGDYPRIKGVESIFFICNDANEPQLNSTSLGIDIMGFVYRFEGGLLDSMFFVDYLITNRSGNNYDSTWLSSWCDMDIGNYLDDLVGTEINANAVFSYNGGPLDGGPGGFGRELASAAMFQRTGPVADIFNGLDDDRDGCIDGVRDANGNCQPEDSVSGIREMILMNRSNYAYSGSSLPLSLPGTEAEERLIMQGYCRTGSHKEVHGNFNLWDNAIPATNCSGQGIFLPWAFPGNSYDTSGAIPPLIPVGWFESPGDAGDKKTMLSAGGFMLESGESIELKLGFLWHRADSTNSATDGGYSQLINKLYAGQLLIDQVDSTGNGLSVPILAKPQRPPHYRLFFDVATGNWILDHLHGHHCFKVIDLRGNPVMDFTLQGSERKRISGNDLPKGIYLLIDKSSGKALKLMF